MIDSTLLDALLESLRHEPATAAWRDLLTTLAVTGVADSLHLRAATRLDRDRLARLIERLNYLAGRLPPVLDELDHTLPRPGVRGRGRAPTVYLLGETGAALLRATGAERSTHACRLKDDTPIAHALAMLDLHLAATQAGLTIQTDRELVYGDGQALRPDHLITLDDGQRVIIEIEQAANADLLRRLRDSVQHRAAFFSSDAGRGVQPVVRLLINLPRGKTFDRTGHYWGLAVRAVFEKLPAPPYRLFALPLSEFLKEPIWSAEAITADRRWLDLTRPLADPPIDSATGGSAEPAPAAWLRANPHDSALLLKALWQDFQTRAAQCVPDVPYPDPAFFDLCRLIYAASHDPALPPLARAGFPRASVYLLLRYLQLHKELGKRLAAALKRGQYAGRWNVPLLRQWMQAVMAIFLEYHGFTSRDTLQVRVVVTDWGNPAALHALDIEVRITAAEVLMTGDGEALPNRDEVARAECALAWTLHALFLYARHLGLDQAPVFW